MRIGSGSTIDVSPASQQPRTAVIRARLVGPSTATWSPGIRPRPAGRRRRRGPRRGSVATERCSGPVGRHRGADERDPSGGVGGGFEAVDRRRRRRRERAHRRPESRASRGRNERRMVPTVLTEGSRRRPLAWASAMSTETTSSERSQPDAATLSPPFRYNAALADRDRAALAGPLGGRARLRDAEPGRRAGRPRQDGGGRREAVHPRHVPVPVGLRPARRPPARVHRHRRVRPLPAHGRAQRAVHDGLRRLRTARRAVRRADRPAPGRHDGRQRRQLPQAAAPAGDEP